MPRSVETPDTVSTHLLGTLHFFDGMPHAETVRKTYDFLDVSRAMETFLNGIPAASIYALLEGSKKAGMKPGELGMFDTLMDARSLFLTPKSTTVYCMTEINVKDGPTRRPLRVHRHQEGSAALPDAPRASPARAQFNAAKPIVRVVA